MEKRKSIELDIPCEEGNDVAERIQSDYAKRARHRWLMHRTISENGVTEPQDSETSSPNRMETQRAFSIMGEDLNLLGVSLNNDYHIGDSDTNGSDDGGSSQNMVVTSTEQMAEVVLNQTCMCTRDSENTAEQQTGSVGMQLNINEDTQATSDLSHNHMSCVSNTHDIVSRDDFWGNQAGTQTVIDVEELSTNAQEQELAEAHDSESDCEIIGIVPNQHGVVMNRRMIPNVRQLSPSNGGNLMEGIGSLGSTQQNGNTTTAAAIAEIQPYHNGEVAIAPLFGDSNVNQSIQHNHRSSAIQRADLAAQWELHTSGGRQNQETQDDDLLVGPIFWGPPKERTFPREYHTRPAVSAYNIVENEQNDSGVNSIIENIEFLFRCPICYSTIARFKSAKMPTENDRIIYSTKCGHMYCFDCIEGVKKRRECPICRKPIRDSKQYHVIYP
ncbi:ring finger domain containing protein 4 [Babesia ovis]|uniref:Ring finger domain containing protein 4 n=1 Tax=Babesia ovis TaxID=5869 RepID=A0A9W5TAQ7_BABOV|nr:ring finger domain containing protein 4 [Babesia ovis]